MAQAARKDNHHRFFVDRSIKIKAPVEKVWNVLTKPEFTKQWTDEFGIEGSIISDWSLGSEVLWKKYDKVVVKGNVTALEPNKLLRYTVFDITMEDPYDVSDEDGITFTLTHKNDNTQLYLLHGDFGKMNDGKKYYKLSSSIWDKVLPKIKRLAEKTPSF